jgi:hypothetical protein
VQRALALAAGLAVGLDPPQNFHGEKPAAELARAQAEAVCTYPRALLANLPFVMFLVIPLAAELLLVAHGVDLR